jgi:WD40 repeat protein
MVEKVPDTIFYRSNPMKKIIITLALLSALTAGAFGQTELPMFFDNELMLQTNETGLFNSEAAYSPDGSKIAVAFGRSKIAIWDVANGRKITTLAGHGNNFLTGIVFSPNGRQLVSFAQYDSAIKIWDTTTGELIRSISQSDVQSISFSPDGSRIVGNYKGLGNDDAIKIWNVANGSVIRTITDVLEYTQSITYSPDGRRILTASNNGIRIWDAGNGQTIRTISSETRFTNAVYSPNGRYITAYTNDRSTQVYAIQIYNAETGQEIRSIPIRLSGSNLAYNPDGSQLLVRNYDSNSRTYFIKIFNTETGQELRSFNTNGDEYTFAFSSDSRRIFTVIGLRLKIDDKNYGASYATLIDATTGRVTGTIGYGPLNVGARAYADLQIARFLGDTAAVNRHEAVLQFITGRGNATRAEIETFYRNNVRGLIASVVDEKAGNSVRLRYVAEALVDVKNIITQFFLNPTSDNFSDIRQFYRNAANTGEMTGATVADIINAFMRDYEPLWRELNKR